MDTIPANFNDLWSGNRELQNKAFSDVLAVTGSRVDWTYDVWDQVLENLSQQGIACKPYGKSERRESSNKSCWFTRLKAAFKRASAKRTAP